MEDIQIRNQITEYIKQEFLTEEDSLTFNADTPLVSSRILDSISTLELVDYLEKTFDIEFSHHEVDQDNLDSVDKIVNFVKYKKQ